MIEVWQGRLGAVEVRQVHWAWMVAVEVWQGTLQI